MGFVLLASGLSVLFVACLRRLSFLSWNRSIRSCGLVISDTSLLHSCISLLLLSTLLNVDAFSPFRAVRVPFDSGEAQQQKINLDIVRSYLKGVDPK
jgi:hypothetical protein